MIRFDHVTRRYEPAGQSALDDVTVEFNRGELAFLIGASGSGKSTLLRMILREGLPQQGRITVAGQNLGLMLERRVPDYRRSIGMVFQDFRLLPDKTVYDNVAFAMRVIGARRTQIRKRVTRILERVNLEHLARRYPHEISGGEQQRAAIARAIVNDPAILLADEPTGNLDPRASAEVIKILRWINASGTTVIMATHDRAIVDSVPRRVVQLHRGRMVRDEARGSYDPPPDSQAWKILLSDEHESGTWSPTDPRAQTAGTQSTRAEAVTDPGDVTGGDAGEAEETVDESVPSQQAEGPEAPEASQVGEDSVPDPSEKEDDAPDTTGIRIVWPEDTNQAAAPSTHPEPTGDFSGAEIPDLDRDGYAEGAEELPDVGSPEAQPQVDHGGSTTDEIPTAAQGEPAEPAQDSEDPPPTEDDSGDDPSGTTPSPEDESTLARPVPRPKSSASQASYTDTQRTAEQLGVRSGSFLRRLRRDR